MILKIIKDFTSCISHFYYCTSEKLIDAIKTAVVTGDVVGFDYILEAFPKDNVTSLITHYSEEFLITSYYNTNFILAEKLIKAGARLKGEYIAHIKHLPKISVVIKHLNNIEEYVNNQTFITLNKIISSHYSSPIIAEYDRSCIDFEEVLLSITYTNDQSHISDFKNFYSELYNHNHTIIKSIVSLIGVLNHNAHQIKILAPVIADGIEGAFYSSEGNLIYSPFQNFSFFEKSFFIHESSHYFDDKVSNNGRKPFARNNDTQLEAFDIAATQTLHSIGKTMKLKFNDLPNGYNYHTAVYDLLLDSPIALFFFNSLLKENTDPRVKNIIFNNVDRQFNINTSIIDEYGKEEAIHITVNNIIKDLNFTSDFVVVLERIGEYVSRPPHAYSTELLVRLAEFIMRNLNQDALSHFSPLENYWLEHHIPTIQKYMDAYAIKECSVYSSNFDNSFIQQILIGDLEEPDL